MVSWQIIPGLTPYQAALDMMEKHVDGIITHQEQEKIILLEHEDTYTAGTGAEVSDIIDINIPIIHTGRGGKCTYHGPGQRVIYPMLNLVSDNREQDIKKYVSDLEKWIIATLNKFDIDAFIAKDRVGIWVLDGGHEKKIAAIGIRARKWVTYHGIAVNISTDLLKFNAIVPCGLRDFGVTSMKALGKNVSFQEFDDVLQKRFAEVL